MPTAHARNWTILRLASGIVRYGSADKPAGPSLSDIGVTVGYGRSPASHSAATPNPIRARSSFSFDSASTALADAAQTTFDAALAAYRNGVGSISDLTIAERQLLTAKNVATDAYSTALSAAATMALAVGVIGKAPG